jgi:CubicO group peptidase (beta-lactamase class C family)
MTLQESLPEPVGMSASQLEAAACYMKEVVDLGALPLSEILVARGSRIVLHDRYVNPRVAEQGFELTGDTIFEVASVTKPLCALVVMRQVEMGRLALDIPVSEYIPEFGKVGKGLVTTRHLLSHSAGMGDLIDGPPPTSTEELLDRVYDQPLVFEPGTRSSYSTLGFEVVAELVRRVSGEELSKLGDDLFSSVGIGQTHFRARGESGSASAWRRHVLPLFDRDLVAHEDPFDGEMEIHPHFEYITAGGRGCSSAADLAVIGQMMLNKGRYGNVRVLSPASAERMIERQFVWSDTPERMTSSDRYMFLSKALGWMVRGEALYFGGDLMSPRAFFHGGAYGSRVLVDPEYDLVLVFMTSTWQHPVTGKEGIQVPEHVNDFIKIQRVFANMVYGALC